MGRQAARPDVRRTRPADRARRTTARTRACPARSRSPRRCRDSRSPSPKTSSRSMSNLSPSLDVCLRHHRRTDRRRGASGRTCNKLRQRARTIPGMRGSSTSCASAARIRSSRTTWIFSSRFRRAKPPKQWPRRFRPKGSTRTSSRTPENGDLRYSLHAHKSMQLTVPDMQELSRRLTDAANAQGRPVRRLERETGRADGSADRSAPRLARAGY